MIPRFFRLTEVTMVNSRMNIYNETEESLCRKES